MQLDSRELELLVYSARAEPDSECAGRIRELLKGSLDWDAVLQLAARHRVTPLVYRQLSRIAPEVLQQRELSALVFRTRSIAGRNLQLTKELIRLLDVLGANHIPAIPIKGPLLAIGAFGSLAWREFEDLDILVRPRDIHRAMNIMISLGFEPERELTRAQEVEFLRSEHAFQYGRDGGQLVVELHWRLQDRYLSFPFDEHELWRTATAGNLFGKPVRCLSAENLLLFLCMHGAKHYWERLEWIACLPAIIRAEHGIDWTAVREQARRMRALRILQLGILLAHDLDPSPYTEAPLKLLLVEPIAKELATQVWKGLGANELAGSRRELYRSHFYMTTRERLSDRLRAVWFASVRIPHPNSSLWESLPLPAWLLFLYYFVKPMRLLRKYGLQGLKGVLRPTGMPLD
jgi:hypothetical protein